YDVPMVFCPSTLGHRHGWHKEKRGYERFHRNWGGGAYGAFLLVRALRLIGMRADAVNAPYSLACPRGPWSSPWERLPSEQRSGRLIAMDCFIEDGRMK